MGFVELSKPRGMFWKVQGGILQNPGGILGKPRGDFENQYFWWNIWIFNLGLNIPSEILIFKIHPGFWPLDFHLPPWIEESDPGLSKIPPWILKILQNPWGDFQKPRGDVAKFYTFAENLSISKSLFPPKICNIFEGIHPQDHLFFLKHDFCRTLQEWL